MWTQTWKGLAPQSGGGTGKEIARERSRDGKSKISGSVPPEERKTPGKQKNWNEERTI